MAAVDAQLWRLLRFRSSNAAGWLADRSALCVRWFARPGARPHSQPRRARRPRCPGSRRKAAVRAFARQSAGGDGVGRPDPLRQHRSRPAAPGSRDPRGWDKVDRRSRPRLGRRGSRPELKPFVSDRGIGDDMRSGRPPGRAWPDTAPERPPCPGARCLAYPPGSPYRTRKWDRRRSAGLRAVRTGKPGDRFGNIAMNITVARGLTNAGETPSTIIAEPPSRRAAEPPSRRAAEPPAMSASGARRGRFHLRTCPPEFARTVADGLHPAANPVPPSASNPPAIAGRQSERPPRRYSPNAFRTGADLQPRRFILTARR